MKRKRSFKHSAFNGRVCTSTAVLVASMIALTGCLKEAELQTFSDFAIRQPIDKSYPALWGMKTIEAPAAWAKRTDCSAIKVAVVDTGMDLTHEDLSGNLWTNTAETAGNSTDDDGNGKTDDVNGWDFVNTDYDPTDDHYHGTHVAGTIGARGDNGPGVAGVCWSASIIPIKVMDSTGSGSSADIISGVNYAVTIGAKVANLSLGGTTYSAAELTAFQSAATSGVLVIAAAGNSAVNIDSTPHYPAAYASDNIVAVGATDSSDALASFSNYSSLSVDIAAPGKSIYSTFPTTATTQMTAGGYKTKYETISGTSMAAPMVAGASALLWAMHTGYTYSQIETLLYSRARYVKNISGYIVEARRLRLGPGL